LIAIKVTWERKKKKRKKKNLSLLFTESGGDYSENAWWCLNGVSVTLNLRWKIFNVDCCFYWITLSREPTFKFVDWFWMSLRKIFFLWRLKAFYDWLLEKFFCVWLLEKFFSDWLIKKFFVTDCAFPKDHILRRDVIRYLTWIGVSSLFFKGFLIISKE